MKNKLSLTIVIRSILLWIIAGGLAVIYNLMAFSLVLFPVHIRHRIIASWAHIFTFFAEHLTRVDYTVTGLDNLVKGPAIIASNHQSMWETIAFASIFPQHVWILKQELLRIPFFGWTVATLSPIAIDRANGASAIQQILSQSAIRIKQGFWILAFPEGTRVKPGTKVPYKSGVAKMAIALNIPIIPVCHNAGYVLPKKSCWLFPGTVSVIIDKPIYPLENESPEDLTFRIEEIISNNLATITY